MNPDNKHEAVRRFIHLVLYQAQQDQATELIVGAASASEHTPIRYKVGDTWYDISPFPSHIRKDILAELARMAALPAGQFPNEGVLDANFEDVRLRWVVGMISPEAECLLKRVQNGE